MGGIFNLESPIMQGLSKLADLVWLNILTFICCIPIVTIGAAFTAQHYVVLKMVRNEEGYITRSFFKSFKENFKQATCIWLIFFVFLLMFIGDVYIFLYSEIEFPKFLIIVVGAFALIVAMVFVYVFPVLSKFDNSVKNTIKNSFMIAVISLPKTILMLFIYLLPAALVYLSSSRLLPIAVLFGFSGTAYLSALLYNKVFKRFEPEEEDASDVWEITAEEEQGEDLREKESQEEQGQINNSQENGKYRGEDKGTEGQKTDEDETAQDS